VAEKEELAKIVGSENYLDGAEVLEKYSSDYSFVAPRKPSCVVKPKNTGEVRRIVNWANQAGMPLVPVSSGPPRFRGDTIPRMGGCIVDLSRMNKILRVDRRNRVAMIEAGVTFAQLRSALAKKGLRMLMPLCPRPSKSALTSYLEREPIVTPKYHWDYPDPLVNVEAVFGSGDIMRTGEAAGPGTLKQQWGVGGAQKNPSGPAQVDYYRIVSGAQGTMGIVTWASVRAEPLPQVQKPYLIPSDKLEGLINFAYETLKRRLCDEYLILSRLSLATLLSEGAAEINSLRETLPPWVLVLSLAGYERYPEERVAYQEEHIMGIAQKTGVEPMAEIAGIPGTKVLSTLQEVSPEPYWKLRYKGCTQDIFFLATLDKIPRFTKIMHEAADAVGYPPPDIGIYIQPLVQGVSGHCEFSLPYDSSNPKEMDKVRGLLISASQALLKEGAYFSRPYYPWADMVYSRDGATATLLRKMKGIFDPNNIMNPGRLCF
jgi:FAD/FMN-containing dehydrogenase